VAQHTDSISLSQRPSPVARNMLGYTLKFTLPNPTPRVSFLEFSPSGATLAVGSDSANTIHLHDRSSGFQPTLCITACAVPACLAWKDHRSFVTALSDGSIVEHDLDLGSKTVINQTVHNLFKGSIPISAIVFNAGRDLLAIIVGPDVLGLKRDFITGADMQSISRELAKTRAGKFGAFVNLSNRTLFKREPGVTVPPFPRSLCFSSGGVVVISYCRENIV